VCGSPTIVGNGVQDLCSEHVKGPDLCCQGGPAGRCVNVGGAARCGCASFNAASSRRCVGQRIVICTGHGAVTLPDGGDGGVPAPPPPGQKTPDCPYCALGCNAGLAKLVLAANTPCPSPTLRFVEVTIDLNFVDAPRKLLRLLTSPPRAPPSLA
jgi:hypothetical protein